MNEARNGNVRFEGGNLVARALLDLGVKQIFSVSGGPLNSIYYGCASEGLALYHTRHEAGACFMAEAVTRVTRTPGVAAVTLGPGVTNAVTPALVAKMASVPLLIIGAQANTGSFERGAGMSADHVPIMAPVTKWAARVLRTERIPEYIQIAWRRMWAGSPGPIFLEIPIDVLSAVATPQERVSLSRERPGVALDDSSGLRRAVAACQRPLAILGNDLHWHPAAHLKQLIEDRGLPFFTTRLARGAVDEHHRLWAGPGYTPCNPALRKALAETDLVLLLGHTFEFDLGYGREVSPGATIVQCVVDGEMLGRNRSAQFGYVCAPDLFVEVVAGFEFGSVDQTWVDTILRAWHSERRLQLGETGQMPIHPVEAVDAVVDAVPEHTIFATSHGNVDFWADARIRVRRSELYLRAGQAGALGSEIPYGVGAALANPNSPCVVFVGDGGVGYHITELETAVRYGRSVIVVVLDDEKWGAIALPQREAYGAEFEMDLPRRDWAKVAEGLGAFGARADTGEEIKNLVAKFIAVGKPALIQIPVRSVLSPYMRYISS